MQRRRLSSLVRKDNNPLSIIEQIKAHEQAVLSRKQPSDLQQCPGCKGNFGFKPHALRRRLFLVIIDSFVYQIRSSLSRWKCLLCGCSFTYYPDFAIPYKRYVKAHIVQLARQYVQQDNITYRRVVQGIGYADTSEGTDERQLEGTMVWRWLSFIGSLQQSLLHALNLIRQKSPSSEVFRAITPVAPGKYRSQQRKSLLGFCMRFFVAEEQYRKHFNCSIFPIFATGYG